MDWRALEKGETGRTESDEEAKEDARGEFREVVRAVTPLGAEVAPDEFTQLRAKPCSKLGGLVAAHRCRTGRDSAARLDRGDTGRHVLRLGAASPVLSPVDFGSTDRCDGGEDVLGWVGVWRHRRTESREVGGHVRRPLARRPGVDCLATRSEQDDIVKKLEELTGRLVDGAEHGDAGRGDLAQEATHLERGVRVKAARRLVEEKEEVRVGSKLRTQ